MTNSLKLWPLPAPQIFMPISCLGTPSPQHLFSMSDHGSDDFNEFVISLMSQPRYDKSLLVTQLSDLCGWQTGQGYDFTPAPGPDNFNEFVISLISPHRYD